MYAHEKFELALARQMCLASVMIVAGCMGIIVTKMNIQSEFIYAAAKLMCAAQVL